MKQRAFIIHVNDNVATAVEDLNEGEVSLIGPGKNKSILAIENIKFGFKIALLDFKKGQEVIKNDLAIGRAKENIPKGSMVHLHNIKSEFDERSGSFDKETGAPQEKDVYQ